MTNTRIPASPSELQTLAEVITEANAANVEAQRAAKIATRCFTLFCEGKSIPGASFVGIEEGHVIVTLPEPKLDTIALVPSEPAA